MSRSLPSIRPSAKRAEWEGECFMFMKRILCAVLCLCLLATGCAFGESVGTLNMPNALSEIRAEAFCGDESMVSVTVPEGVKRIDSRAFAESGLKEIALPASLEYIADDAFEGCDDLVVSVPYNSYAHEWVAFTTHEYVVTGVDEEEQDAGQYGISAIEAGVDEETQLTYVSAGLITDEACRFVAEILDDSGEICLFSASTDVEAGLYGQEVRVYSMEELPVYFTVRAKLVDNEGNVLYEVRNIKYTDRYARYDAQTPDDFPEDRVKDYGSSGYAVFNEGVTRTDIIAEDLGNGMYRYNADGLPEAGDLMTIMINGSETPVKVLSAADNGDGTVTVLRDSNAGIGDFYSVLNIDTRNAVATLGSDGNNILLIEEDHDIDIADTVTGKLSITMDPECRFIYDPENLGPFYFDYSFWLFGTAAIELELSKDIDTWKEDKPLAKIPIDEKKLALPGFEDFKIDVDISAPLHLKAEAGSSIEYTFKELVGFNFNTDNGFTPYKRVTGEDAYAHLEGKAEVWFGLRVTACAKLFELLDARVSGGVGLEGTAEMTGLSYGGSSDGLGDYYHACNACVDVDLYAQIDVRPVLRYKINEHLGGSLLDEKIVLARFKCLDAYLSLINEKDSIYGGKISADLEECSNYKYHVQIVTDNYAEETVSGIPVTVSRGDEVLWSGYSPCNTYLYEGDYTARARFDSGVAEQAIAVDAENTVFGVRELETIVDITVVDADTEVPVEAAEVVLTYEDGTEFVLTTDADGKCTFDKLGGGKYNVSVNKAGYRFVPIADMNYEAGTINCLKIGLEKTLPLIMASSSYDWQPAYLPGGLELPEGVPQVWVAPIKDGSSICGVSIRHEDCEEVFEYRSDDIYTWSADLYGFDMGDGEYTYLVRFDEAGTDAVGGVAIIVKVIDGKLELLKSFERYQRSDDIRFDAEFVSATAYEGVLYPSGNSIRHTYNVGEKDRTGIVITETTYGTMDYRMSDVGCYELIYSIPHCPYWEFGATIGYSYTRYAMENGELVVAEQWYVPFIS